MAKSTRSKVKRTYRAKKREDGVYAAIEAARLARLSAKLKAVASLPTEEDVEEGGEEGRADVEGDEVMEDADAEGVDGEKTEGKGWCRDSNDWDGCDDGFDFPAFGLLGPEYITLEVMERFRADGGVTAQTATSIILGSGPSSVFSSMAAIALGDHAFSQGDLGAGQCRRIKRSTQTKGCH